DRRAERTRHERVSELAAAAAAHAVAGDAGRDTRVQAAARGDRLERDITRLERRVRSRTESLARQFDRVLRVLETWGYVDGWALTAPGELLARLYTETDLLLAESLREGTLDGLGAPDLAAVVSCFTYERRGADGRPPPPQWPSREVSARVRKVERVWRELAANEDDAGLPETRPPDPGFAALLHDWVEGHDLEEVLADDEEMTGGDFVRNVKQCIDLLRQVAEVAPHPDTAEAAATAADACLRGVVAASNMAGR
ncbi:MAG TPA: RNA helicase, partial [Acidimicrobiia bacterium]